jgi:hypothetical protein
LFVGGLAVAVFLIVSVGAGRVAAVLRSAGGWLPLVALLEIVFVSFDVWAARVLLGAAASAVTGATWVRASLLAYAGTILLPTGKAAGETVRAATLAGEVGAAGAAGACARLQAASLVGNAVISVVGAAFIHHYSHGDDALTAALLVNALVCAVLGTALFLVVRSGQVSGWLRRRFSAFLGEASSGYTRPGTRRIAGAQLLCAVGRCAQTAQYAVVMLAIGGVLSPVSGFRAQGIHLVGAAVGDVIPGQLGATEGTYRAFAGALGFGADPARALSVPLLVRLAQLGLALGCLLIAASVRRQTKPAPEAS